MVKVRILGGQLGIEGRLTNSGPTNLFLSYAFSVMVSTRASKPLGVGSIPTRCALDSNSNYYLNQSQIIKNRLSS